MVKIVADAGDPESEYDSERDRGGNARDLDSALPPIQLIQRLLDAPAVTAIPPSQIRQRNPAQATYPNWSKPECKKPL